MSAHQQQRPSGPVLPLPRHPSRSRKLKTGSSPTARLASTRTTALINFDVPLHKVLPPSTATHAGSGAGLINFPSNTLNTSLDIFADQVATDLKTTTINSKRQALAMGARTMSGTTAQRKQQAQRRSVNLKTKLSGTRLAGRSSRTGQGGRSMSNEKQKALVNTAKQTTRGLL